MDGRSYEEKKMVMGGRSYEEKTVVMGMGVRMWPGRRGGGERYGE